MKIYWTLASIPELADLPPQQQVALWRRYSWRALRSWRALIAAGFTAFFAVIFASAGLFLLFPREESIVQFLVAIIGTLVLLLTGLLIGAFIFVQGIVRVARTILVEEKRLAKW